ncbi:MAG TPA: histidine kinase [Terriglobales bacterium]|jgi:signal transduction histidine kinase
MSSRNTFTLDPSSTRSAVLREASVWAKWFAISGVIWLLFSVFSSLQQQRIDISYGREAMSFSYYLHIALVNNWIYAILGPLIVVYTWKIHSRVQRKRTLILLHVAGYLSYTTLHALCRFLFAALHDPRTGEVVPRSLQLYGRTFLVFVIDDIFMYLTFAAGAFGYHYYRQIRDRELSESRLQAQLATAQLQILKMQLQPHFLFNTLHAISTLVTRDAKRARKMIVLLSELLRIAIDYGITQEVPLKEEIDFVSKYLDIEKMRFEEDLNVHFDVDPEVLHVMVPNLLLQPLVENAVKHGVRVLAGEGVIHVGARRDKDWLVLRVTDNGPGMPQHPEVSGGLGLKITRARLEQLYGNRQSFLIENLPPGGASISIRIPFRTDVQHDRELEQEKAVEQ